MIEDQDRQDPPVIRTWTEPDGEARKDPRHQVLTDALRGAGTRAPADRIWGRFYGQGPEVGASGNVWAGDPEDVADVLVRALWKSEGRPEKPEPKDEEEHRCPRCGSTQWVSVSLDSGWSRIAQCVPCGAYGDKLGPGWKAGG